jgi:molybdopterin/thiamine biosynthesis adenylyltransferase/rhodanese-related sulfurtransferase
LKAKVKLIVNVIQGRIKGYYNKRMDTLTREEITRYARQIVLPEVGVEGQKKLKKASVLIIGAGGLGSPVALYLAAAGIGHIGIVDYDSVDKGNLHRQVLYSENTVGLSKVKSAVNRLKGINPDIHVEGYNEVFAASTALRIAKGYDILVDASDNFPTRYLVNDLSVITQRPFVHGSVYRFEGQVMTIIPGLSPCYRCVFPNPPPPESVNSCAVSGVLGVVPGIIGTLQTAEVIKLFLGVGSGLTGRLLLVDVLDMGFQSVQISRNPACAICGEKPTITELTDTETFCGSSILPGVPVEGPEMTPLELAAAMKSGVPLQILDVREPGEIQISDIAGARHIRLAELKNRIDDLDPARETIVYCRSGIRSMKAVVFLQQSGFKKIYNLLGGINAWVQEIDPSQPTY